jgi:hypothetical protein
MQYARATLLGLLLVSEFMRLLKRAKSRLLRLIPTKLVEASRYQTNSYQNELILLEGV